MINLCGAPDGIRCYNMAHNIQIRPKLTIFVTFQMQSYYSAVFLTDWKSKFLIEKICNLYETYIKSLSSNLSEDVSSNLNANDKTNPNEDSLDMSKNSSSADSDRLHMATYSRFVSNLDKGCELFLKIKDILVKTTDEVLNNLHDQSRFLIEFDMSATMSSAPCAGCASGECGQTSGNLSNNENESSDESVNTNSELPNSNDKQSNKPSKANNKPNLCTNNKVKIIMIPSDQ
jgi:hypothetical protein